MSGRWVAFGLLAGALRVGEACTPREIGPKPTPEARPASVGEAEGPPLFEDITASSGVQFRYRNGEEAGHLAILESLGGGVGVLDYDGDGLPDLFLTGGGQFAGPDRKDIVGCPCKLFH